MSQQIDEKLFMLMAHAEDLERIANKSLQTVNGAIKRLENDSAIAITSAIRTEIAVTLADLKNELQEATTGLVRASTEGKATCGLLKRTGLFQGFFLVAIAIVIAGAGFAAMSFIAKSKATELDELRAAIRAEQSTFDELQGKTWGLELVKYQDGTRGIILPKGVKVDRTGTIKDGREAVVIKP